MKEKKEPKLKPMKTVRERRQDYIEAKELLDVDYNQHGNYSLCRVMHRKYPYIEKPLKTCYPELWMQRTDVSNRDYWWPRDEKNHRIEALNRAIAICDTIINEYEKTIIKESIVSDTEHTIITKSGKKINIIDNKGEPVITVDGKEMKVKNKEGNLFDFRGKYIITPNFSDPIFIAAGFAKENDKYKVLLLNEYNYNIKIIPDYYVFSETKYTGIKFRKK